MLENTIGNIWFRYLGVGIYRCASNSLFTLNKTTFMISYASNNNYDQTVQWVIDNETRIDMYSGNATGNLDNMMVVPSTIEIRVYN